jgi:catechol 2,3-dioxygenase-like lactoylglutathione lyase family enzyme
MINGIHHPCISTGNLERALDFYQGLLGLEQVFEFSWESGTEMSSFAGAITGVPNSTARAVMLKVGNAFVEIFEFSEPKSQRNDDRALNNHGISHICFDVSDVQAIYDKLSQAGVTFNNPPVDVGPMRITYCRDPDGNFIELQQITDPESVLALKGGAQA